MSLPAINSWRWLSLSGYCVERAWWDPSPSYLHSSSLGCRKTALGQISIPLCVWLAWLSFLPYLLPLFPHLSSPYPLAIHIFRFSLPIYPFLASFRSLSPSVRFLFFTIPLLFYLPASPSSILSSPSLRKRCYLGRGNKPHLSRRRLIHGQGLLASITRGNILWGEFYFFFLRPPCWCLTNGSHTLRLVGINLDV